MTDMPKLKRLALLAIVYCGLLSNVATTQFPLGPGEIGPQPVVDPALNEFIVRSILQHARGVKAGGPASVEIVSARRQGDLVFVFSRVGFMGVSCWRTAKAYQAEVQYTMVQRQMLHTVYELWYTDTCPWWYQRYNLSKVRYELNEELHRYDKIAGESAFPGYPRGPSTVVPTMATSSTGAAIPLQPPMPQPTIPQPLDAQPAIPTPKQSIELPSPRPMIPPVPMPKQIDVNPLPNPG